MHRYIDADAFLWELTHWKGTDGNYHENSQTFYTLDEVMDAIEEADAEADPVKRGKWIIHPEVKNIYGGTYVECSECREKYVVQYIEDEKFCRNCGAKMEADNEKG